MSPSEQGIHPFFEGTSPHGNVRFNFRGVAPNDLAAFAHGYHLAGHALVDKLANAPGYPDYEGYPVLYLYRHALELYMKAILYRGAKYVRLIADQNVNAERFYGSHDLVRLLPAMREIFDRVGWHGDFDLPGLKTWQDFSDLVRSIDSIDHGSYAFRYPMNTRGDPALPHHFVLNVIAFGRNMDGLLDLFSGAASGLDDMWDNAAEGCYFLQEIAKEWRNES